MYSAPADCNNLNLLYSVHLNAREILLTCCFKFISPVQVVLNNSAMMAMMGQTLAHCVTFFPPVSIPYRLNGGPRRAQTGVFYVLRRLALSNLIRIIARLQIAPFSSRLNRSTGSLNTAILPV